MVWCCVRMCERARVLGPWSESCKESWRFSRIWTYHRVCDDMQMRVRHPLSPTHKELNNTRNSKICSKNLLRKIWIQELKNLLKFMKQSKLSFLFLFACAQALVHAHTRSDLLEHQIHDGGTKCRGRTTTYKWELCAFVVRTRVNLGESSKYLWWGNDIDAERHSVDVIQWKPVARTKGQRCSSQSDVNFGMGGVPLAHGAQIKHSTHRTAMSKKRVSDCTRMVPTDGSWS